jgi:hypothetical protein
MGDPFPPLDDPIESAIAHAKTRWRQCDKAEFLIGRSKTAPGPADIGAGALIKPEAWTPRLQKLRKKLREERRLARLDWRVKR